MNETVLTQQVKRKLNITWEDSDTDNRVSDIMGQAKSAMLRKLGIADTSFDFSVSSEENRLYLAYCLYLYNHCENEFDANYTNDILQVREFHEVKQYMEAVGNESK